MTEDCKKRHRTDNVVSGLVQAAASSVGVAVPHSRLIEKLPVDMMAHMLGMLSLKEGVQLRTVSKPPGNRFVLPENKSPLFDKARLWSKQLTSAAASDKAMQTLRQSLRLTQHLTTVAFDAQHVFLLSRLHLNHLHALTMLRCIGGDLTPLTTLVHLRELDLGDYQRGDLSPLSTLTNLTKLILCSYKEGDLSPLAKLVQLRYLDLHSYRQGDLTALSTTLVRLELLALSKYRHPCKLTPLVELTFLSLGWESGDLTSLGALVNLQTLRLVNYQGGDLRPLSSLVKLHSLELDQFRHGDVAPLVRLVRLTSMALPADGHVVGVGILKMALPELWIQR